MKKQVLIASAIAMILACSCSPSLQLYSWGEQSKVGANKVSSYEMAVCTYYNTRTPEAALELAETYEYMIGHPGGVRKVVPPGICAEYGFFLMQDEVRAALSQASEKSNKNTLFSGDIYNKGRQLLEQEMALYPESAVLIAPILKKQSPDSVLRRATQPASETPITQTSETRASNTRMGNYPAMYRQGPMNIVVMPPINKTTTVEAKEYFYYTVNTPLCEAGYYVVSPFLAMELFRAESAYDSELFVDRQDLSIFQRIFNADALLFTVINSWDKSKIAGKITVNADYILKSAKTSEVLFQRNGSITIDTSIAVHNGGLIGALVGMAATALATTEAGKVRAARSCNYYIFKDIPRGRYDTQFLKDQQVKTDDINVSTFLR